MPGQLYLWHGTRKLFSSQIKLYVDTYTNKVFPVFSNIEKEADELADKFYNEVMGQYAFDGVDPAEVAENALDAGVEYYEDLSLMRYNTIAMCIAMMYQFWEQQVRKFLFDEVSHYENIEASSFCDRGIDQIKKVFCDHNFNIEVMESWGKINELRLLCNVIKHGDGKSAKQLQKINPRLFAKVGFEDINLMELYNTTLLKGVLSIEEKYLSEYAAYLIGFWYELPERMYRN